ncbi:hypothetical protein WKW80_27790, partial [Variovorax humicola]
MSDLGKLDPVAFDQGKGQWVEGKCTGIDRDNPVRTHTVGIPHLMPGTIIFVHDVNSESEWYRDAAEQFAHGLNFRLGRDDLQRLEKANPTDVRFLTHNKSGNRTRSPIIPFYWGVHAARRLANLVKTIRRDLPNEPINIIAHSQGTMIALCSLFYLDGVRGPDTLILNSSPYRFDTGITDYLAAAGGTQKVASTEARVATFAKAAEIMQKAKDEFNYTPAPKTECAHQPVHRHKYDDKIFVHQPPDNRCRRSRRRLGVLCLTR